MQAVAGWIAAGAVLAMGFVAGATWNSRDGAGSTEQARAIALSRETKLQRQAIVSMFEDSWKTMDTLLLLCESGDAAIAKQASVLLGHLHVKSKR